MIIIISENCKTMKLDLSPPTRIPSKEPTCCEEGTQFPGPIAQ